MNQLKTQPQTSTLSSNGSDTSLSEVTKTGTALKKAFERADIVAGVVASQYGEKTRNTFHELVRQLRSGVPYADRDLPDQLTPAVKLHAFLLSLIKDRTSLHHLSERSCNGLLPAEESAECILDETRTRKFLDAVQAAVLHQRQYNGTDRLHVIDAGCGSIPILSIQAALSDPKLTVTALEFNPLSVAMARQVVSALGLKDRITVIEADATKFVPEKAAHVIVSETLQAGLGGEPVVQVLANLKNYLTRQGTLLPSGVQLSCGLMGFLETGSELMRTPLGPMPIVVPRWLEHRQYRFGDRLDLIEFNIRVGKHLHPADMAVVAIDVRLGAETLHHFESLVTTPRPVLERGADGKPSANQLIYEEGSCSRLRVEYVPGGIPAGAFV